jgi:hypothetical protein
MIIEDKIKSATKEKDVTVEYTCGSEGCGYFF